MFSKFTHAGMVLTGLNLTQKIVQSFFLSYVGTASARIPLDEYEQVRGRVGAWARGRVGAWDVGRGRVSLLSNLDTRQSNV
jgi:hypothetical protein